MSTGDYKPVMGFGGGIGLSLNENINFILGGGNTSMSEHTDDPANKINYEYHYITGGIEYIPTISFFEKYLVSWKSAIKAGWSEFKLNGKKTWFNIDDRESGLMTMFNTGLQYNFTQVISPYFDLGFQKTFFNTNKTSLKISGLEMDLGVRFYILGNRDYENGY